MVRLTRLSIDPAQLGRFTRALKEEIEVSLRVEPGVQKLVALSELAAPSQITILGVFADEAAYRAHLASPHYLRYREKTRGMVRSYEQLAAEALTAEDDVEVKDEIGVGWGFG